MASKARTGCLERIAPWRAAKTDPARAATILYHAAEALRLLSEQFDSRTAQQNASHSALHPVLPERTSELWPRLGWTPLEQLGEALAWGSLSAGQAVVAGTPLFPRDVNADSGL